MKDLSQKLIGEAFEVLYMDFNLAGIITTAHCDHILRSKITISPSGVQKFVRYVMGVMCDNGKAIRCKRGVWKILEADACPTLPCLQGFRPAAQVLKKLPVYELPGNNVEPTFGIAPVDPCQTVWDKLKEVRHHSNDFILGLCTEQGISIHKFLSWLKRKQQQLT